MIHDYPFSSNYFKIGENRIHYLDEGQGPVITMVHGNPTWSYYFRHLIKNLSKEFRIIVPDHMGCGLSDKPANYSYTLANHVDNLTSLLEYLNIASTSFVVHDWGGAIGMGYATQFVERIENIVILNTAAFRSKSIPFRIKICRWPVLGEFIVRGLNGFAWPATFMAVKKRLGKEVSSSYLLPYDSWENRVAIYGFVRDIPLDSGHISYETLAAIEQNLERLKESKIPMLIVWGGQDFCFNDNFYNEWRRRFPEAICHYLEEAGHYVLEDGHGIVEPLIHDFFQNLSHSHSSSYDS